MKKSHLAWMVMIAASGVISGCTYRHNKDGSNPSDGSAPNLGVGNSRVSQLSFSQVKEKVLANQCMGCHAWMGDYRQVYAKREKIRQRVLVEKSMPQDKVLSAAEFAMMKDWLEGGSPETGGTQPTQPAPLTNGTIVQYPATWENFQTHFLKKYCTMCHGGPRPRAGLDLTNYEEAKDNASYLVKRALFSADDPMPPTEMHIVIAPEDKLLLINWVAAKAPGPVTNSSETENTRNP